MYGLTSGALIQLGNAKQHRPLLGGCQVADHPTEVIWARGVGKARTPLSHTNQMTCCPGAAIIW